MPGRKNPVVDEVEADAASAEPSVEADAASAEPSADVVEPDAAVDATDAAVDASADASADGTDDGAEHDAPREAAGGRRRKGRVVAGALGAVVLAAGAVWAAGALGGDDAEGLPLHVTDPAMVVTALDDAGFGCTGSAVAGDVATCNSTLAVRVFDSPEAASAWIKELLADPKTSSALGWVQHGNVVVSAPLDASPDVAEALGPQATVH